VWQRVQIIKFIIMQSCLCPVAPSLLNLKSALFP
jgi:hypothetical protein